LTKAEGDLAEPPWPQLPEPGKELRAAPEQAERMLAIAAPLMPEA